MQDRKIDGKTVAALTSTALLAGLGCNYVTQVFATPGPENTGTPQSQPLPDATVTPTSIFDASATPGLGEMVWIGQADANRFRAGQNEADAFRAALSYEASQIDRANGDINDRSDHAATALNNEVKGPEFDATRDPMLETGNELTGNEVRSFSADGHVLTFLAKNPSLKDMAQPLSKDQDKVWFGVWGDADDRDALTAVAASVVRYETSQFKNDNKVDGNTSLLNTVSLGNSATIAEVRAVQDQIVSKTSEKELPVSATEQKARNERGSVDASVLINDALKRSDQMIVCEEVADTPDKAWRASQPQTLIEVEHIDGGLGTVTEANVAKEQLGFIVVFDTKTGKWDVTAITSRGFNNDPFAGDQSDAVSLNELEPCGVGAAPVPTATHRPNGGPTPTHRPPEEATVTEAPTQPPQPTRTEGGSGETPVVNTPVDTPVPATQEVPPTVPPTDEPIPTPIF